MGASVAWSPWEKFSRAASRPASASRPIVSGAAEAGPSVARIFAPRPSGVAVVAWLAMTGLQAGAFAATCALAAVHGAAMPGGACGR